MGAAPSSSHPFNVCQSAHMPVLVHRGVLGAVAADLAHRMQQRRVVAAQPEEC